MGAGDGPALEGAEGCADVEENVTWFLKGRKDQAGKGEGIRLIVWVVGVGVGGGGRSGRLGRTEVSVINIIAFERAIVGFRPAFCQIFVVDALLDGDVAEADIFVVSVAAADHPL